MSFRDRRAWLFYTAILFNVAVYLAYVDATVVTAIWRKTEAVGDMIRAIGWEAAFDAVDALVVVWLLVATACLFVRRPIAHRFAVMTNLFLVPSMFIPLARHYQYYGEHFEAYPPSLDTLSDQFHIVALWSGLLLAGALLLLAPGVRRFFVTPEASSRLPRNQSLLVSSSCFFFSVAVIYVRAPW